MISDTAGVTPTPNVVTDTRTRLQQQQLQQQLQAVAAAAAAAQQQQQQKQIHQQSAAQAPSPPEVPAPPPSPSTAVQQAKQQQSVVVKSHDAELPQSRDEIQQQFPSKWCQLHVYKKSRVTWLEAYRTCRSIGNGTELATVKSEEEYAMLNSKVKEAGSPASVIYWTAGTDLIDEGEFFWMTDGTAVRNAQWAVAQPDNHWESEHCIALKRYPHEADYKMTDENCLMAGAFICTQPCKFWV